MEELAAAKSKLVSYARVEDEALDSSPICIKVNSEAREAWRKLPETKTQRVREAIYQIIEEMRDE